MFHAETFVTGFKSESSNEQCVLSLRLNFAVPPREIPKRDIIAEVEKGLTRVQDTLTADRIRLEVSQALRSVNKKSRLNLAEPNGWHWGDSGETKQ